MCILCVVQRWSHRVATRLPWLVVPLVVIWVVSQLLPPNLRFEITSPRLACVAVLLVTLLWYEFLMPYLWTWRARRTARLREERRIQSLELQKRKKEATRRCRNCNTPYKDQNPGGGRFMCCYCGHISKRPVLEDRRGESRCLTKKSYSGVLVFGRGEVGSLFFGVRWVCEKVFRVRLTGDGSVGGDTRGGLNKRGENGGCFQESRGEKARRKAEEKRQARLEKELLEEEERKQREEVARLVEERRRLRDEVLEAEKSRVKGSSSSVDGERESRKESERKKKEKRREKDKGSCRSSSDGEEIEKRVSRESEKKRENGKKSEIERRNALLENLKLQVLDGGIGNKVAAGKSRYFHRMRGTFLSSSRGFNGASFFGRNAEAATLINKVSKPAVGIIDHKQNSGTRKDACSAGNVIGKYIPNGDHRPVGAGVKPQTTIPKKSWHHLFARSSTISADSDTDAIKRQNGLLEDRSVTNSKVFPGCSLDNEVNFGASLPLNGYSSPVNSFLNGNNMFPPLKEPSQNSVVKDVPLEDLCDIPDPVGLLGPVSDSLDNFLLDMESGVIGKNMVEGPRVLKNATASVEVTRPSPIESPLSKQVPCTPNSPKLNSSNLDEPSDPNGLGTWQMWGTPLPRDGFGLAPGPSIDWFSPPVKSKSNGENGIHPLARNTIISQIAKESLPLTPTPKNVGFGNVQNGGRSSPYVGGLNRNNQWMHNYPFPPVMPVDGENHIHHPYLIDNSAQSEVRCSSLLHSLAAVHPFEASPASGWHNEEWELPGRKQLGNSTPPMKPPNIGSLFSTGSDVQPIWSFNHQ